MDIINVKSNTLINIPLNSICKNVKVNLKNMYHIHSNKCPGHLDKSFWVRLCVSLFLARINPKMMILTGFKLIPSNIDLSM